MMASRRVVEAVRTQAARPGAAARPVILRGSSSTPMTPVEAGSTCGTGSRSSLGRRLAVASATASPVRVAQLALPGIDQHRAAKPFESFRCLRQSFTGAACTRFCVNTAAALAGKPADDQREIVLFAPAGCRRKWRRRRYPSGRFNSVALLKSHSRSSAGRWRNRRPDIRLRPSSCTSSNSSAPSPQPPAAAAHVRMRARGSRRRVAGHAVPSRCAASGRERSCRRPARAAGRARDCESRRAAVDPVDRGRLLFSAAALAWPARRPASRGTIVPPASPASVSTSRSAPITASRAPSSIAFSSGADLGLRLQQHVARVEARHRSAWW